MTVFVHNTLFFDSVASPETFMRTAEIALCSYAPVAPARFETKYPLVSLFIDQPSKGMT